MIIPTHMKEWFKSSLKRYWLLAVCFIVFAGGTALASRLIDINRQELTAEQRISEMVARMSLPEKIGQMVLVDKNAVTPEEVKDKAIGGVLSGGGGNPKDNTPEEWRRMVADYQDAALDSEQEIPILYGVDAVHGNGNVKDAVIFPHNIGLGASRNAALVETISRITAEEIRATGANWNFAPVLSLPSDLRWGRVYECFSSDREIVTELGVAAIRGLQTGGVLATPKHFIGEGAEEWNTSKDYKLDQGDIRLSKADIEAAYLKPFSEAVKAGAMSIMVSRSSINGQKISADKDLLTGRLKGDLGFRGFLVSDWGAVDQIPGDYYSDIVTAINAGLDMVMLPGEYQDFIDKLSAAVANGAISQERIDDAVTRILRAKQSIGLFEKALPPMGETDDVGATDRRELGRQAVRESLVLLKNENSALPIKEKQKILVVGRAADDVGMQSGGWTIEWQGGQGATTPGTSLLQALKDRFGAEHITYDPLATQKLSKKADYAIAVVGEQPYAEGKGDRENLALSPEDIARVASAKKNGKRVIILIMAGRPLVMTDAIAEADAVVMAWLPGTEGAGLADVLSGTYNFSGKLPLAWPRDMGQVERRDTKNPLYPIGSGLRYEKK